MVEGKVEIFTTAAGLLKAAGHDLTFSVGVAITTTDLGDDRSQIDAVVNAGDISLVGSGVPPTMPGRSDAAKISKALHEVLRTDHYPEIVFSGELQTGAHGGRVEGRMTLVGETRAWSASTRKHGDEHVAEGLIVQPDFGIKPFKALFGSMKVAPEVQIRITARDVF